MGENREDVLRLRGELLAGEVPAVHFLRLWDNVPQVRFFAKSAGGRFLSVSPNLLELNCFRREEDMLGLSDFDLYPNSIAEKFVQDDGTVLSKAEPMGDILEIFLDEKGAPDWYLTHKLPIRTRNGNILGVMGTSRKFTGALAEANPSPALYRAVRLMKERFTGEIAIPELAACDALAGTRRPVSDIAYAMGFGDESHFIRTFKGHMGVTPLQYRLRRS